MGETRLMTENDSFRDLLDRVRRGDEDAAATLVRRYEPAIRRAVRIRLVDARFRALFDSMDVCQSVMGSFFFRVALGQFDLTTPDDLVKLLVTMARNKLADQARRQATDRRGKGLNRAGDAAEIDVAGDDPTASRIVSAREILKIALEHLTPEERRIAERRANGHPWADLAVEAGTTAEALRKKHARALERVAEAISLDV